MRRRAGAPSVWLPAQAVTLRACSLACFPGGGAPARQLWQRQGESYLALPEGDAKGNFPQGLVKGALAAPGSEGSLLRAGGPAQHQVPSPNP